MIDAKSLTTSPPRSNMSGSCTYASGNSTKYECVIEKYRIDA